MKERKSVIHLINNWEHFKMKHLMDLRNHGSAQHFSYVKKIQMEIIGITSTLNYPIQVIVVLIKPVI